MIIKVLQFGSNWWPRFGRGDHRYDPRQTAYFNSSGIRCGSKTRRYWVISGLLRFNGVSEFDPSYSSRSIGQVFECSDLRSAYGGNRVLFRSKLHPETVPDYYLVVVSNDRFGIFDFQSPAWKSASVEAISASDHRSRKGVRQEALVLMPSDGWLASATGKWKLCFGHEFPHRAALQIEEQ